MLDHIGSTGEIGREVEAVESGVFGQGRQGPGVGGRVVVFFDDLRVAGRGR